MTRLTLQLPPILTLLPVMSFPIYQLEASQFTAEISRLESQLSSSIAIAKETKEGLESSLEAMKVKAGAMEAALLIAQADLDASLVSRSSVESQLVASLSAYQSLVAEKQALADKAAEQEVQQQRLAEHLDRVENEAEEAR